MNSEKISVILSLGFKKEIRVKEKRPGLFQAYLPFFYPDGDMLEIFIRPIGKESFQITDLGFTLMKLSYEFEINTPNKKKLIIEILDQYQVQEADGELSITSSHDNLFSYLMHFINVVIKISDVSYLKRETIQTLFYESFDTFVFSRLEKFKPEKNYYPKFDTGKLYPSPYAILRKKKEPISLFPVLNDSKSDEVTITCLNYERNDYKTEKIAIFEDQGVLNRLHLAKLTDVVDKQFSKLEGNQGRIVEYLQEAVLAS